MVERGAVIAALPRSTGMRAIVAYKAAKAVGETLLALVITVLIATGYVHRAHELAEALRAHVVHHWSIRLAELLLRSLTPKHLWFLVAAAAGDAIVSGVEGWALARGYAWGAWMVVGATGLLLPVEIYEMTHRITVGRVLLFAINLAIVVFLTRKTLREHHGR